MATEPLAAPAPGEQVVMAAIDWMVRLQSGTATDAEHAACRHWRSQDVQHELAWQRLQGLSERVASLPSALAHGSLGASPVRARHNRRFAIKTLSLVIGTGLLAVAGGELLPWRPLLAQYRTATGQRRRVVLDDGSVLELNTATAIDTSYSPQTRLVQLQQGEVLITTGHEAVQAARPDRPFLVQTRVGRARALGTRFQLRDSAAGVRLAVFEGAVEFRPDGAAAATRVDAGQQALFDRHGLLAPLAPAREDAVAWVDGVIVANRMRLGDLVAELDRYMPGKLRCDDAIAALSISGVFPIDQPARILAALARTLPLRIDAFTDYWITLRAQPA